VVKVRCSLAHKNLPGTNTLAYFAAAYDEESSVIFTFGPFIVICAAVFISPTRDHTRVGCCCLVQTLDLCGKSLQ
jgi:hypothetical protein